MVERTFVVPRLDDPTVIAIFDQLRTVKEPSHYSLTVLGLAPIDMRGNEREQSTVQSINRANSYLISDINFGYSHFSVRYARGGAAGKEPSLRTDDFRVVYEHDQNGITSPERLKLLQMLMALVGPTSSAGAFTNPPTVDDLESLYRSTIIKLETAFASQIEKISNWTITQAGEAEKRRIDLADETQKEREQLRSEYEAKHTTLQKTADELEKKRQELDDRDYMHARRAIRGDLQKIIAAREQKFSLTAGTKRLRWPIHVVMLVLIGTLATLNWLYFSKFSQLDLTASWPIVAIGLAKQGVLAAALIAAILYYMRWMNRWFEDHSAAEFLLKQFQLDVDRASWIVETALEWRRVEKAELPTPLLEGIARNLFVGAKASTDATAADDLASAIFGNASQLKMKIGENELSFDRKAIGRLAAETKPGTP
jgi:hypothetical protein